jgi:glyoxylase-like metal-dependent hydrolase (beta-lactamase superfamily II)
MILKRFTFPFGPLEVNLFVMGDERSDEALLVDAGVFDPSVTRFIQESGMTLTTILITHLHRDHIDGLARYVDWASPRVISPAPLDAATAVEIIQPGHTVKAANFEFQVFKTSGHTPESVSYYCAGEGLCFVGDALFAGAVGGTSEDSAHAEEIGLIKQNLMTLPGETRIYSGHGPATRVAIEEAANPFLQPGFTRLP